MRISDWSSDVCSSDLRFSRRAPSDRPVETIFIDAAEVAEQRRILNRIISGGEPVVVHGVPSGQLRLDIAARPAEAEVEAVGRFGNRLDARRVGREIERSVERVGAGDRQALGIVGEHRRIAEIVNQRSEEHTSEPQSLMGISYAVFRLNTKTQNQTSSHIPTPPL